MARHERHLPSAARARRRARDRRGGDRLVRRARRPARGLPLHAGPVPDPAQRRSTARTCAARTRSAPASTTASCASACARCRRRASRTGSTSTCSAGDTIQVMAPQGRFFVPIDPAAARHYLGIAGGSGITPILSIMKTVLAREPQSPLHADLRQPQAALDHVQGRARGPEEPLHDAPGAAPRVLARSATDSPLNQGVLEPRQDRRVPGAALVAAGAHRPRLHLRPVPDERRGRGRAARRRRRAEERIHIERFGVAARRRRAGRRGAARAPRRATPPTARDRRSSATACSARSTSTQSQRNILDAAAAAGLDVPFSCKSGVCGTCRAKLLEGEVRMERNFALEKHEVAAGFVLTCQAHPLTERVVLSFDDR